MAVSFNDLVKQCLKSEKITVQKTFCIALVKDGTNMIRKYSPNQPRDENGRWTKTSSSSDTGFVKPTLKLSKKEYAKVCSEISTNYSMYEGKEIAQHITFDEKGCCYYLFENHGFGEYNIFEKGEL